MRSTRADHFIVVTVYKLNAIKGAILSFIRIGPEMVAVVTVNVSRRAIPIPNLVNKLTEIHPVYSWGPGFTGIPFRKHKSRQKVEDIASVGERATGSSFSNVLSKGNLRFNQPVMAISIQYHAWCNHVTTSFFCKEMTPRIIMSSSLSLCLSLCLSLSVSFSLSLSVSPSLSVCLSLFK